MVRIQAETWNWFVSKFVMFKPRPWVNLSVWYRKSSRVQSKVENNQTVNDRFMFQLVWKSFPKEPCKQGHPRPPGKTNCNYTALIHSVHSRVANCLRPNWDWAMDSPELWWLPDRFSLVATENGVKIVNNKACPGMARTQWDFFPSTGQTAAS